MKALKWVAGAAAVGLSITAAYELGRKSETGSQGDVATVAASAPPPVVAPKAHAAVANSHPTIPHAAGMPSGTRFAHFKVGNSNVKALLTDGPVLWVGTSGGVIRYDTAKDDHRLYDVRAGLLSNGIFHLSKFRGRLAVGTYGGGLSLFDEANNDWANYNIQHGLADAFIYDLLETDDGDLWIATWSGANLVKGGRLDERDQWQTFTVENTGGGLPNDWVYGLAKGRDGEVWMATEGGLARYLDGTWTHWKHEDGLGADYELVKGQIQFQRDPAKESSHHARQKEEMGLQGVDVAYNPNYIVALHVDAKGFVWCGTWGGGLARFDGREWINLTVADGLPANHVFMLESAGDGAMWVGTSNGMAHFDGERFTRYSTDDGLYANNIFSLARGEDDSLWVGSFGGVARLTGLDGSH
ncbi:MAG: hypothetical protein KDH88_12190 [Chromatiales bacterium]|nr:hypothetical protein [Chromatiales bacterium]